MNVQSHLKEKHTQKSSQLKGLLHNELVNYF